jgi:pSer/pThr/pTyr-binding forkhead associated (FHA) protein
MSDDRGGAYISVHVANQETLRRPIEDAVVIGRSLDCDVCLEEPILSRHHCRLEPALEGDGWAVIDLNSRNGTFLNAKRLIERQVLSDGDIITVGRAHIRFHASGYVPPREPPRPIPRDPNAETLGMSMSDSMVGRSLPFSRPAPSPRPKER